MKKQVLTDMPDNELKELLTNEREKLIKLKKTDNIIIKNQKYSIKIFENLLDGSENFALIKGNIKSNKNIRVRVISSNIVQNYLMGKNLPNSFIKTIEYFKTKR